MIHAQMAVLCDAASIREGLLSVLGAGISVVTRDEFPAPLEATLAILLQAHGVPEFLPTLELSVRADDGQPIGIEDFEIPLDEPTLFDTAATVTPLVIDMQDLMVPGAGTYVIKVAVDGSQVATIRFLAQVPDWG